MCLEKSTPSAAGVLDYLFSSDSWMSCRFALLRFIAIKIIANLVYCFSKTWIYLSVLYDRICMHKNFLYAKDSYRLE